MSISVSHFVTLLHISLECNKIANTHFMSLPGVKTHVVSLL